MEIDGALAYPQDDSESLIVVGNKDSSGNPTSIQGMAYSNTSTGQLYIEIDPATGLPTSITNSYGQKASFTNYTDNTVEISFYDNNGVLVSGPEQCSLDSTALANLKNLWNSINDNTTAVSALKKASILSVEKSSVEEIENIIAAQLLKLAGQEYSVFVCSGGLLAAVGTGGLAFAGAAVACTPMVLNIVAELDPDNETIQQISTGWSAGKCGYNIVNFDVSGSIVSCSSAVSGIISGTPEAGGDIPLLTSLTATTVSSSQINLSWNPSNDPNVDHYNIYLNNNISTPIQTVTGTSINATNLQPSTEYCYSVSAYSAADVPLSQDTRVCATTLASSNSPLISNVSPNPVIGSNNQQPFNIYGTNFVSGANIILRDVTANQIFQNRVASYFTSTQITLNPNFTTAAHNWSVEVINPDGQTTGQFTFQVIAPASVTPAISSVSPNPVTGSNSSQPFTINGSNFVSGATVTLRDHRTGEVFTNRPISSFSSTQIIINPIFTTYAATWSVEVINPGGYSSGQFYFDVVAPTSSVPVISSVSPNPVTGSNSSQPFTINGSNFVSGATVTLRDHRTGEVFTNRPISSFSSTQIIINPIFTTYAATWSVEVINPGGYSSGQFYFDVVAPTSSVPSVSSVSPNPVTGSNSSQPFTINGSNFVSGATVTLRDHRTGEVFTNRPISSFSSTQIVINPIFTTYAATWSVEVINPGGYSSGQFYFNVVAPVSSVNLTPYQPAGWSDKIVVSKITGTYTDSSPLYSTDTLYVDWAVINNGSAGISTTFYTWLYVDGNLKWTWSTASLPSNNYFYAYDFSIGSLSAGTHTIKVVTDAIGSISESNEGDNEYTKTITIY